MTAKDQKKSPDRKKLYKKNKKDKREQLRAAKPNGAFIPRDKLNQFITSLPSLRQSHATAI